MKRKKEVPFQTIDKDKIKKSLEKSIDNQDHKQISFLIKNYYIKYPDINIEEIKNIKKLKDKNQVKRAVAVYKVNQLGYFKKAYLFNLCATFVFTTLTLLAFYDNDVNGFLMSSSLSIATFVVSIVFFLKSIGIKLKYKNKLKKLTYKN